MHTLMLMRHAQAGNRAPTDEQRPLTEHGRAQAAAVGRRLAQVDRVDLVLCSSSTRTRQTLDELGLTAPVEFQQALYLAGTDTLRHRIAEVDESVGTLLVIGHNAGIGVLAGDLASQVDVVSGDELGWHFPTAALQWFTLAGPWTELGSEDERVQSTGTLPD